MIESIKNTVTGLLDSVSRTQLIIAAAVLALLVLIIVLIVVWRRRAAARRREDSSFFDSAPTDTFAALGYADLKRQDARRPEPDDDFEHAPDVPAREITPPASVVQGPAAQDSPPSPAPSPAPEPANASFNWDATPALPMPAPAGPFAAPTASGSGQGGPAAGGGAQAAPLWPAPGAAPASTPAPPSMHQPAAPTLSALPAAPSTPAPFVPQPAPVTPHTAGTAAAQPASGGASGRMLVPLNELVRTPSTELVDLSDPEVRRMLTSFVSLKIERAMDLRHGGQIAEALTKLAQAEKITRALGMDGATQHVHEMIAELNRPVGTRS